VVYQIMVNAVNMANKDCFGKDVSRSLKSRVVMVTENLRRVAADDSIYLEQAHLPSALTDFEAREVFLGHTVTVAKAAVKKLVEERIPLWNDAKEKEAQEKKLKKVRGLRTVVTKRGRSI